MRENNNERIKSNVTYISEGLKEKENPQTLQEEWNMHLKYIFKTRL